MATGAEMMMKQLLKALGVNADDVMKQIHGISSTIGHVGMMMKAILEGVLMANRRLARIEAHLGLSDIEPVPHVVVIDNEKPDGTADDRPALASDGGR